MSKKDTKAKTATERRRHNLKAHEAFEKEMKGINDESDVTVVRPDGKEFVVKGKAVRSHLERGFTVKSKKAGKKAANIKLDGGAKPAAKKAAKK